MEMKKWIDNASFDDLFETWRDEPMGSKWFLPPIGPYFEKVFKQKIRTVSKEKQDAARNLIGW